MYAYGGLRPLVDDQTKSVYTSPRKYEIFDPEQDGLSGLLTVEGGKYTTCRNLAENVLKTVNKKFPRKSKSVTAHQHLAGCEIRDLNAFVAKAKSTYRDFPEHTSDYLARVYGTELPKVMEIARSDKQYSAPLNAAGEMSAQALYAIRYEMASTLKDILIHRTGIGTLGHPGMEVLESAAKLAVKEMGWDRARMDCELESPNKTLTLP